MYLPIVTAGTNLREKYVDVSVVDGASPCKSPQSSDMPITTQSVTINGIQFLQQIGGGAAASNYYNWTAYSTLKNSACISLTFMLHSVSQGVYDPTPPAYDPSSESAIFSTVMSTYGNR